MKVPTGGSRMGKLKEKEKSRSRGQTSGDGGGEECWHHRKVKGRSWSGKQEHNSGNTAFSFFMFFVGI